MYALAFMMVKNFGYLELLLLLAKAVAASIVEHGELNGDIFDITHAYMPGMPIFGSSVGSGPIVGPYKGINDTENRELNYSPIQVTTDSGTHVKAYTTVKELDIRTLNGKPI